jgi:DNA mismatch repair protein MutS
MQKKNTEDYFFRRLLMQKPEKITPMMQQFFDIKEQYPDTILFFRMGDFYEMFGDDAVITAKILGIALTSRDKKKDNSMPMCGFPHHSYQPYLIKMLKAGKNVAICDQLEDPAQAKGIVKRGVTKVVTPGTVIDDDALPPTDNNYLATVYKDGAVYIAFTDLSTGEVYLETSDESGVKEIIDRYSPSEVIANYPADVSGCVEFSGKFSENLAARETMEHYGVGAMKSLGLDDTKFACPIYMALSYMKKVLLDAHLLKPKLVSDDERVHLDSVASSTLELVKNSRDGSETDTLYSVLNHTKTTMGARTLKKWLLNPLRHVNRIFRRQEIVEYFVNHQDTADAISAQLDEVYDIERIASRLSAGRSNARDLVWLKNSTSTFPMIKYMLEACDNPHIEEMAEEFDALADVTKLIDDSIVDDPPITITEGGLIKQGYNPEVDELKSIKENSRKLLLEIETKEKERTGISNLKVKFNKVFGYYIEVSNANKDKVPEEYIRKQTLVNAERFIIPELKELEEKILHAESRLTGIEHEIFLSVRKKVAESVHRLRLSAGQVSEIDCLLSLAKSAVDNDYRKPLVGEFDDIKIKDGRHPVVEKNISGSYVPNDIEMDIEKSRLTLITGPNMAGKSTYLRMCALITLMAHVGSFVPASHAEISMVDRIFTRVGASDNLAGGESTFMVEMVETANILNNATDKSLIILDEIGRGTSTFDGVSIAWSVAEYIAEVINAKTLFATHYHEMTDIAMSCEGVKNCATEVAEHNGELIFMRKVKPGTADKSYGIHVAELAGLPKQVVARANDVLKNLEKNELSPEGLANMPKKTEKKQPNVVQTMLVFDDHPVVEELKNLDINNLTPMQALSMLAELKDKAAKED